MTYIECVWSAYYISLVGNPALLVPRVFSKNGLPIGTQIVGRHNADLGILQMGFAFEQAANIGNQQPKLVE